MARSAYRVLFPVWKWNQYIDLPTLRCECMQLKDRVSPNNGGQLLQRLSGPKIDSSERRIPSFGGAPIRVRRCQPPVRRDLLY